MDAKKEVELTPKQEVAIAVVFAVIFGTLAIAMWLYPDLSFGLGEDAGIHGKAVRKVSFFLKILNLYPPLPCPLMSQCSTRTATARPGPPGHSTGPGAGHASGIIPMSPERTTGFSSGR